MSRMRVDTVQAAVSAGAALQDKAKTSVDDVTSSFMATLLGMTQTSIDTAPRSFDANAESAAENGSNEQSDERSASLVEAPATASASDVPETDVADADGTGVESAATVATASLQAKPAVAGDAVVLADVVAAMQANSELQDAAAQAAADAEALLSTDQSDQATLSEQARRDLLDAARQRAVQASGLAEVTAEAAQPDQASPANAPDLLEQLIAQHVHGVAAPQNAPSPPRSATRLGTTANAAADAARAREADDAAVAAAWMHETHLNADVLQPTAPIGTQAETGAARQDNDPAAAMMQDALASLPVKGAAAPANGPAPAVPHAVAALGAHPQWTMVHVPAMRSQLQTNILSALQKGNQSVEFRMDPPEWGRVRVRMTMEKNQVQLEVHTEHEFVKSALEGSLAELKKNFSESGLQLSAMNVDVGGAGQWNAFQEQRELMADRRAAQGLNGEAGPDDEAPPAPVRMRDLQARVVDAIA